MLHANRVPILFSGIRSHSTDGYKNLQKWNSIRTANIVTLHTVFTIKAFGDQSIMFVYDYHPAAETLMQRHFTQNHYFGKKRPQRKLYFNAKMAVFHFFDFQLQ